MKVARCRARSRRGIAAVLVLLLGAPLEALAASKIIHRERSLYRTILVAQDPNRLCMQFSVRRNQRNQSCTDRRDPRRLVFEYAKLVFASLLVDPNPERILVVGLGGGTLPVAYRSLFPEAHIDVVEIDPAVVKVAREYFDYAPSEPGRMYLQDARIFGKRAASREASYDLILLDAFNGDYIPEHLMTREYLLETRRLLEPGGVLLANTFSISALYHHESATYASVFGAFYNLRTPASDNRVIMAVNGPRPTADHIEINLTRWADRLAPLGVDLDAVEDLLDREPDWDISARVLTDQYSPANLLRD